ncbi:hypothetical protein ACOSZP_16420 [Vibrio fluvialis]|uniref:hypothetical protein n=1 Tax=Vibrio fluvialis TaxID=676 RepID=UPI001C9DA904|nr:hypothetical protein [Vibrio fluvialis]
MLSHTNKTVTDRAMLLSELNTGTFVFLQLGFALFQRKALLHLPNHLESLFKSLNESKTNLNSLFGNSRNVEIGSIQSSMNGFLDKIQTMVDELKGISNVIYADFEIPQQLSHTTNQDAQHQSLQVGSNQPYELCVALLRNSMELNQEVTI